MLCNLRPPPVAAAGAPRSDRAFPRRAGTSTLAAAPGGGAPTAPPAGRLTRRSAAGTGLTCAFHQTAGWGERGLHYPGQTMTYLDHAATTPMRHRAAAVMSEAMTMIGNASSLHTSGRRARRAVKESREDIADALGARPSEVIFTGVGTEGDNLAVKGIYWGRRKEDPARRRVLASSVEHHAVLDAVEWLAEHEGAEVTWLPVDSCGRVQPEVLEEA